MAITDFSSWLNCVSLDYNDVYDLYRSVSENDAYGCFQTVSTNNEGYIVKCDFLDEDLFLASDKAKNCLLNIIEKTCCNGMDIEGYWAFHHSMEKDD